MGGSLAKGSKGGIMHSMKILRDQSGRGRRGVGGGEVNHGGDPKEIWASVRKKKNGGCFRKLAERDQEKREKGRTTTIGKRRVSGGKDFSIRRTI